MADQKMSDETLEWFLDQCRTTKLKYEEKVIILETRRARQREEELKGREKGYLSELADYGKTVKKLRDEVKQLKQAMKDDYEGYRPSNGGFE